MQYIHLRKSNRDLSMLTSSMYVFMLLIVHPNTTVLLLKGCIIKCIHTYMYCRVLYYTNESLR